MPNWKKVVTSGSNAVLNEITSSGGILTHEDIMPNVDNTLSLGSTSKRFQLNGGTPVTDEVVVRQILSQDSKAQLQLKTLK